MREWQGVEGNDVETPTQAPTGQATGGADLETLARVVGRVIPAQQIEPRQAEQAVIELLAGFSVYRSYLADGETDALRAAAAEASRRQPRLAGASGLRAVNVDGRA